MSNGRQTLCACCQRDFVVVLSSRAKTPAVCELGPDTLNAPRSHRAAATASKHKVLHCHHTAAAGAAIPPPLPPRTGKHKPVQLHSHLRTHRLPEASAERFECLSSLKSQTFHDFNDFRASEVLFYHHFFYAVYSRDEFNGHCFKQNFLIKGATPTKKKNNPSRSPSISILGGFWCKCF